MRNDVVLAKIETLINELKDRQQSEMLQVGRRLIPQLTSDDALQPNDFPQLENDPHFRYEEGVLSGILIAEAALRSLFNE